MSGTALDDVISALVDGLRGTTGWRSPWDSHATAADTPVYDSTEAYLVESADTELLIVGYAGDRDGGEAASAGQAVATIGTGQHREETGTVVCVAIAQSGDSAIEAGVVPALRGTAAGIIHRVDDYLRAHGSLGLVPAYRDVFARVGSIRAFRPWTADAGGIVAEFEFEITFRVRL
jgi:hypothetical protein